MLKGSVFVPCTYVPARYYTNILLLFGGVYDTKPHLVSLLLEPPSFMKAEQAKHVPGGSNVGRNG